MMLTVEPIESGMTAYSGEGRLAICMRSAVVAGRPAPSAGKFH